MRAIDQDGFDSTGTISLPHIANRLVSEPRIPADALTHDLAVDRGLSFRAAWQGRDRPNSLLDYPSLTLPRAMKLGRADQ